MTKPVIRIADLIADDADDVTRMAVSLSSDKKVAAIREIATQFDGFAGDVERLKLLLFVQAALASLPTRSVPAGTAATMVAQVQPVANVHDKVVRRVALQVLALLFLKSRQLTAAIDKPVRAAFKVAKADEDETVRAFAKHALSAGGALRQRTVNASGHTSGVVDHVRAGIPFPRAAMTLRNHVGKSPSGRTQRAISKTERKSTS